MKNLCIIPVKENSRRLHKKNIKKFFGKPLFVHSLNHARDSTLFDKIHISTSSKIVEKLTLKENISIDFLRPEELSQDTSTLYEVCKFTIEEYEQRGNIFDNFCLLWATSPMREVQDIKSSYDLLLSNNADAVVGVCEYNLPFQCAQKITDNGLLSPVFENTPFWEKNNNQIVCDNGSLCWVNVQSFKKHETWLPPKTYAHKMPFSRSIDIDTHEDWEILEYFYKKYKQNEEQQ